MDILTVVFKPELPYLKMQARSLCLYAQDLDIQNIFVIVNDKHSICCDINSGWWGSLANKVTIIPRDAWGQDFESSGWVTQQALKILGTALSTQTWCMVLDAKTFLIQKISTGQLTDNQGRICMGVDPILPVFLESQNRVNKLFDINMSQVPGPSGVPHFFHVKSIQDLIQYVEHESGHAFVSWFQDQGMITEFVLHSGWIHCVHGSLNKLYSKQRNYRVFNVCHTQASQFDSLFAETMSSDILSVGLHRNAWTQLSHDQQVCYLKFLKSKNIIDDISTEKKILAEFMS